MKHLLAAALLSVALFGAACTADTGPVGPPKSQRPAETSSTSARQSVPSTTEPRPTARVTPEAAKAEEPAPPAPERPAPTAGYQCREGDEELYDVCASHQAWIDGQREFAACTNGGGTWNIPLQKCSYPPRTKAPSPDSVHSSDPGYRDANGETYAEYCARTGQPLNECAAG